MTDTWWEGIMPPRKGVSDMAQYINECRQRRGAITAVPCS